MLDPTAAETVRPTGIVYFLFGNYITVYDICSPVIIRSALLANPAVECRLTFRSKTISMGAEIVRGISMKCPNCQNRKIDVFEARGFTSKESPIKECACGHVWRLIPLEGDNKRIDTIREGKDMRAVK